MANSGRTLIGLVLAITAMGFASNGPQVLAWIEAHPGLAGWLQALGSSGAIYAAWAVGAHQVDAGRRLEAERRQQGIEDRLKIVMALLSNVLAICSLTRRAFDESTIPEAEIGFFGQCRDNLSRVDPFMIPSPEIAVRVLGLPLQLQRLIDAYGVLERVRGTGEQVAAPRTSAKS